MITIRKALASDMDFVNQTLSSTGKGISLVKDDYIMIMDDDGVFLGLAAIRIDVDRAEIVFATMFNEDEDLEDGLLRSLINLSDRRGVKHLVAVGYKKPSLLEKIGFKPIGDEMVLDVIEFFEGHTCQH